MCTYLDILCESLLFKNTTLSEILVVDGEVSKHEEWEDIVCKQQ